MGPNYPTTLPDNRDANLGCALYIVSIVLFCVALVGVLWVWP